MHVQVWTKTHRDAAAVARAYGPEEERAARRGPESADAALLRGAGTRGGRWSAEEDLALREAHVQVAMGMGGWAGGWM